jgi:nucleoside-diphosphate-sugar epimerase
MKGGLMHTLVTGGTGRVGSRFVPRLLRRGEAVRILVRDPTRAQTLRERGAEVVAGDLRDAAARARAVDGVDAIVHLGASFRGVPAEETIGVNETATVELARAALAAGVARFVFANTNLVYGAGRGRPAREDDPLAPTGDYPRSKAVAEGALTSLYDRDGLGVRVLRIAFVYGDDDPHLTESLMWAREWPAHKRLHMVHHADVGQALIRALRADGIDGEAFNVADDAPVSAVELHDLNGEQAGADIAQRVLEDPWEGIVDMVKICEHLGFRPIYPSVYTAKDAGAL